MPNRTLCDVLNEMRKAYETRNFSYLIGLIEEAQSMGSRMEARLYDIKDFKWLTDEVRRLRALRKKLKKDTNDESPDYA